MNRAAWLAVPVVAVAAAGCGGGGSAPVTPVSVAKQIGAVVTGPADHGPFAKAAAEASWHGKDVVIATFGSDGGKRVYIKYVVHANKSFGITTAPLAQGHDYVVFPLDV